MKPTAIKKDMKRLVKEIMCRISLHYWEYPTKYKDIGFISYGAMRVCKTCKLRQWREMISGKWMIDL